MWSRHAHIELTYTMYKNCVPTKDEDDYLQDGACDRDAAVEIIALTDTGVVAPARAVSPFPVSWIVSYVVS